MKYECWKCFSPNARTDAHNVFLFYLTIVHVNVHAEVIEMLLLNICFNMITERCFQKLILTVKPFYFKPVTSPQLFGLFQLFHELKLETRRDISRSLHVFSVGRNIWPLMRKRFLGMNTGQVNAQQAHRSVTDSQAVETEWPNGYMDEENFWTDAVKRIQGWQNFLIGCSWTDELLTIIFERFRLNGWTFEENSYFWTDAVKWMNSWRKQLFFKRPKQN